MDNVLFCRDCFGELKYKEQRKVQDKITLYAFVCNCTFYLLYRDKSKSKWVVVHSVKDPCTPKHYTYDSEQVQFLLWGEEKLKTETLKIEK